MEKLTVLVVDDDREIVESIAIFLQADGYLVRKAYNGLEALDIVMTENVHLIILDIMMPELDGIKTLLKVRESKNLPIILLSAKSEDADKILGLTAGADDYITKPFNPSERDADKGNADCHPRTGARHREQKRDGGRRSRSSYTARIQNTRAAVPSPGQGVLHRGDLPAGVE